MDKYRKNGYSCLHGPISFVPRYKVPELLQPTKNTCNLQYQFQPNNPENNKL